MVRVAIALISALCGCHTVFEVAPPPDAEVPIVCAAPLLDDPLDDGAICEMWGQPREDAGCMIRESPDGLVFAAIDVAGSRCRCTSRGPVTFSEDGIAVEVTSVMLGTTSDFTLLSVGADMNLSMGVANGQLVLMNNTGTEGYAELLYAEAAMRWWRLRRAGADVVAEYGADGRTWTQLGVRVNSAQDVATPYLFAGISQNDDTADGQAVYRRFMICP